MVGHGAGPVDLHGDRDVGLTFDLGGDLTGDVDWLVNGRRDLAAERRGERAGRQGRRRAGPAREGCGGPKDAFAPARAAVGRIQRRVQGGLGVRGAYDRLLKPLPPARLRRRRRSEFRPCRPIDWRRARVCVVGAAEDVAADVLGLLPVLRGVFELLRVEDAETVLAHVPGQQTGPEPGDAETCHDATTRGGGARAYGWRKGLLSSSSGQCRGRFGESRRRPIKGRRRSAEAEAVEELIAHVAGAAERGGPGDAPRGHRGDRMVHRGGRELGQRERNARDCPSGALHGRRRHGGLEAVERRLKRGDRLRRVIVQVARVHRVGMLGLPDERRVLVETRPIGELSILVGELVRHRIAEHGREDLAQLHRVVDLDALRLHRWQDGLFEPLERVAQRDVGVLHRAGAPGDDLALLRVRQLGVEQAVLHPFGRLLGVASLSHDETPSTPRSARRRPPRSPPAA